MDDKRAPICTGCQSGRSDAPTDSGRVRTIACTSSDSDLDVVEAVSATRTSAKRLMKSKSIKRTRPANSEIPPKYLDRVVNGDCLELLRDLPSNSVDLVVSSPPYNLGKEYEAKRALDIYIEEQTIVLRECARVLKTSGSIFWQVGAFSDAGSLVPLDIRFFPILEGLGLLPKNRIIWVRQHGLHATRKFSCRHETILWFTKSDTHFFDLESIRVPQKYQNKRHYRGDKKGEFSCNPAGKNPGDIWVFRNVKHNHEEQTIHPCQFPEDLIARIVLATTPANGTVLDPYMGTGTVAIVARDHGRHFAGAERDKRYHAVALRRLQGTPDANGSFANLKCLRDFCERTGESISNYRFDVQIGKVATDRSKAKIFSEEYHLDELDRRLNYEEDAFAAARRGDVVPTDYFDGGQIKSTKGSARTKEKRGARTSKQIILFTDGRS